jgi:putative SOS response-associated peptidase YedK
MCGRYGFSVKDAREVYDRFGLINTPDELNKLQNRYNIAPGQINPVIVQEDGNKLEWFFWGLIPYWAKNEDMKYKTINARAESVDTAASYRKPLRFQRCLIPATGFYEWDKSQKPSQPYYFQVKDNSLFAFAGLYDIWKNPQTNHDVKSYTIITTQPNDSVKNIHNRMPVILEKEDEETWLNPDLTEPEQINQLLQPYPSDKMFSFPVSRLVNTPSIDSEELIKPASNHKS